MSVDNEVQTLMKFGLTASQARALLCLSAMGTSEAKSLVQNTRIPRQDIYRILDELFEKGLVEKVVSKPVKFRAMSPVNCIEILVRRRKNEIEKLEKEASTVFSDCHNNTFKEKKTESRTVLVPPREPLLRKAEELITSLKKNLLVLSPPHKLFPWIFTHQELFEKAIRRNVRFNFITMKTERRTLPKFFCSSNRRSRLETRFVSECPSISFGVFDDRTMILELSPDSGYLESQVIMSDNKGLVELALVCFKSIWIRAEKGNFHVKESQLTSKKSLSTHD